MRVRLVGPRLDRRAADGHAGGGHVVAEPPLLSGQSSVRGILQRLGGLYMPLRHIEPRIRVALVRDEPRRHGVDRAGGAGDGCLVEECAAPFLWIARRCELCPQAAHVADFGKGVLEELVADQQQPRGVDRPGVAVPTMRLACSSLARSPALWDGAHEVAARGRMLARKGKLPRGLGERVTQLRRRAAVQRGAVASLWPPQQLQQPRAMGIFEFSYVLCFVF